MADKKAPVDTSAMFAELAKLEKTQDFDKAVKVCNKILNVAPSDAKAFHCKMVALIQLGRFDDALRQIADSHLSKNVDMTFEQAYCHYKLNDNEKSLAVIEKNPKSADGRLKELKAQIYYRLEKYEDSYDLYRDIMKNTNDDFELERQTNLQAVAVHVKDADVFEEDESYEMCYNRGCQLLAQGRWAEAETALKAAEEMCKTTMKDEEADEEEIERETGIIRVQAGFAMQMQGDKRDREAAAIYNSVLRSKPDDIGLVAVASNNLMTLNKDQNIFDSKKRIKAATVDGLEHKLTTAHRATIARNNALLAMYTNQVDVCGKLVTELAANFQLAKDDQDLIMAGVLSRSGNIKEAVELLLKGSNATKLERVLIAAQIYLEKGQLDKAIKAVESLPKAEKYRTGMLSALVSLYLANNERSKAAQLLKEAVNAGQKAKGDTADMALVWRKTAEFHMKGGEPSVATHSLEELLKLDPKDKTTLAQLVLAYAKFDLKKAMEASKKLPDFVAKAVDVDALESSAVSSRYGKKGLIKPVSPKPQSPDAAGRDELAKKKRKKKRKKRLPKDYNPNVDPDPERWLARRERTGYRKTRKERRKGEKFTGAQGTAAGQSENFDYSKKSASQGAIPKSPNVHEAPPPGPRTQRKGQQKSKKKGAKNRF